MVAHFEGRRNLITETRIRAFDGSLVDVLFTVTYPIPPEQLDNTFITIQDISERLNAEHQLRKLQADFSHAGGRIATLGELATSIAHEINQPLAAIVTNGETKPEMAGAHRSKHRKSHSAHVADRSRTPTSRQRDHPPHPRHGGET